VNEVDDDDVERVGLLRSNTAINKNANRLDNAQKMIKKLESVNLQMCQFRP